MPITAKKGNVFADLTLDIDGSDCTDTTFRQVRLVYNGGNLPSLDECRFVDCLVAIKCPKEAAKAFLRVLCNAGQGGKELAETQANELGISLR